MKCILTIFIILFTSSVNAKELSHFLNFDDWNLFCELFPIEPSNDDVYGYPGCTVGFKKAFNSYFNASGNKAWVATTIDGVINGEHYGISWGETSSKKAENEAKKMCNKQKGFFGEEKCTLIASGNLIIHPNTVSQLKRLTAEKLRENIIPDNTSDAIRAFYMNCWSIPLGIPFDESMVVNINLYLNKDGSLETEPEVLDSQRMNSDKYFRTLAQSALRAIKMCGNINLPINKYHEWNQVRLNFDPRQILRGNDEIYVQNQTVTQTVQVPKTKVDKIAPVLDVEDRITVTERNYTISGKVSDDSEVFVEADGISIPVKNNKFTIQGSSSIGITKYKIVAFDKWGNETTKNIIVERVMQTASNDKIFEPLRPEIVRSKNNRNRIALIIGMEEYKNMSSANFAKRDAELFIDYAQSAFGISQSNIKYFINAENKIKFDIRRWLKKNVRKNTEVYLYFSGHGIALNRGIDLYLLTNDTEPDFVEETAFNRNEIFNDIAKYNPKSVTAFLDTCYSGAGRADGEILLAMAKGLVVVDEQQQKLPDNFTLFTAASAQESAWSLPEAKHGTFSYFLMKGIEGEADLDGNKKLTNGELQEYLLDNVSRYAQQQQTPQMIGDPDQVLVRF